MRDIRDDLRQRVQHLRSERDELQRRLKEKLTEIDDYEAQLSALLEIEERRAKSASSQFTLDLHDADATETESDLEQEAGSDEDFEAAILSILKDERPWAHGDIKARMEKNWTMNGKSSIGRAIQGQLLSMKQRGLVEYVGDRKWRKRKDAVAA